MGHGMNETIIRTEELQQYLAQLISNKGNEFWINKFKDDKGAVIHLAVMVQPYLSRILSGEKTIESRYSINMVSPYKRIKTGDIVLLKKSGGFVEAIFEAGRVQYYSINSFSDLEKIKEIHNERLKIEEPFWEQHKKSKYATLIDINKIMSLPKFKIYKKNRTAWMTLGPLCHSEGAVQMGLNNHPRVVCIVGKIASGKTYVSQTIARNNGWVRCSTSDYLRDIAKRNGNSFPTREQLQELGRCEIGKGWSTFAKGFLDYATSEKNMDFLIIDGIRHIEFFYAIRDIVFPQKCHLVYLEVPDELLHKRRLERGEIEIDFNHMAEGDQQRLYNSADFISDGEINGIERFIKVKFNSD